MLYILILTQFLWAQEPQLQGRWVQSCENGNIREELFSQDYVTLTESSFLDLQCQRPFMTFINEGTYQASQGKMDFIFKKVKITLHDAAAIADFNQRAVCGFTDWTLDTPQETTGLTCKMFEGWSPLRSPRVGEMRFGIYKIEENKEGDRLFFGRLTKDHDALSPERRPSLLDPRYYVKQGL